MMASPRNNSSFAETNIQLLGNIYPDIVERLNRFLQRKRHKNIPSAFELKEVDRKMVLCRRRKDHAAWIHGPDCPIEQARGFLDSVPDSSPLVIVWNAGLGYVPRLLEQERSASRMILCESRWELVWEWLCRWDCRSLIESTRYLWILQEDADSALLQWIDQYPSLLREGFDLVPGSGMTKEEEKQFHHVKEHLSQVQSKTPSVEHESTEPGSSGPVFFIMSSTMPEMMPSILRGAEQAGFIPKWNPRPYAVSRFLEGLDVWKETCGCIPKVAVGFYGSSFSKAELKSMGEAGVRRVVWYYDNPEKRLQGDEGAYYDLALTFDENHLDVLCPVYGEKARLLQAATSFDDFQPQGCFNYSLQPVTYVGATGYRLSIPILQKHGSLSARLMHVVQTVVKESLGSDPVALMNRLYQATSTFESESNVQFRWLVRQLATSEIRKQFLQAAQPYGLSIFGDAIWGQPKFVGPLSESYMGTSLRYDSETPELYAASKINLSLCPSQVIQGVPLRVYDTLACGGFLLAEYRKGIETELTIGKDLDVFRTPAELAQKIEFYLQREDLRRDIAAHGQQTVLERHTYRHRIETMMQLLESLG